MNRTFAVVLGLVLVVPPVVAEREHPPHAAALLARLKSPDPAHRVAAVRALAQLEAPAAMPALAEVLKSDESALRLAAIQGLARRTKDAATIPDAVLDALCDEEAEVARLAVWIVAFQRKDPRTRGTWIHTLKMDDLSLAAAVDEALGQFFPPFAASQGPLFAWLKGQDPPADLPQEPKERLPVLLRALAEGDWNVKRHSLQLLEALGEASPAALTAIAAACDDADPGIAGAALRTLGAMPGAEADAALAKHLTHASPYVRRCAAFSLARREAPGVARLVAGLEHESPRLRDLCLWALQRGAAHAAPALPRLTALLGAERGPRHHRVLRLLARMGDAAAPATEAITALLKDELLRRDAIRTLGAIGPKAAPAVETLAAYIDGGPFTAHAITAATKIGDPRVIPAILSFKRGRRTPKVDIPAALRAFGEKGRQALVRGVFDAKGEVQILFLKACADEGIKAPRVLEAIHHKFRKGKTRGRTIAANAAIKLGYADALDLDALLAARTSGKSVWAIFTKHLPVSKLLVIARNKDFALGTRALASVDPARLAPEAGPVFAFCRETFKNKKANSYVYRLIGRLDATAHVPAFVEALADKVVPPDPITGALARVGAPAVPALVAVLESDKAPDRARKGAVIALLRMKEPPVAATEVLVKTSEVAGLERWSREALQKIGAPALTPVLERLLDEKGNPRSWVVQLLAKMKGTDEALRKALRSEDANRRYAAMLVYKTRKSAPKEVLQSALEDVDGRVRASALALMPLDEAGLGILVALLHDGEEAIRIGAATRLGDFAEHGEKVVPELILSLKDGSSLVRQAAIQSLGAFKDHKTELVPKLVELLAQTDLVSHVNGALGRLEAYREGLLLAAKHPLPSVRQANLALMRQRLDQESIPYLLAGLQDKVDTVRLAASQQLHLIKATDPKKVIPGLVKGLEDPSPDVRLRIAQALKNYGEAALPAAAKLGQLLISGDPRERRYVAHALAVIGTPGLKEALPAFRHGDYRIHNEAMKAFRWGKGPAVPLLLEIISGDEDPNLRKRAENTLRGISWKDAVPELRKAMGHKKALMRRHAAYALGLFGSSAVKALPELIKAFDDKGEFVASTAIWAVGRMGATAKDAAPALKKLVDHSDLGSIARDSLKKVGG